MAHGEGTEGFFTARFEYLHSTLYRVSRQMKQLPPPQKKISDMIINRPSVGNVTSVTFMMTWNKKKLSSLIGSKDGCKRERKINLF